MSNTAAFLTAFATGLWAISVARLEDAPELWQADVTYRGKTRFCLCGARSSREAREWAKSMIAGTTTAELTS